MRRRDAASIINILFFHNNLYNQASNNILTSLICIRILYTALCKSLVWKVFKKIYLFRII